ncbi:PLP-dependent transferase [Wilcoxina mikolae CBS 423.85]|nr:PLP-dependent transferase [Wilcoxina mikolae CBS 423.85]
MCGVYRTDEGKPFVLPSVIGAKQKIFDDLTWNHEYPPSHLGTKGFRDESAKLFFGQDSPLLNPNRIVSMQTLGGSGACHMGALFLKLHYRPWKAGVPRRVYIPNETWTNHPNVFSFLGLEPVSLPYYDPSTNSLAFSALNAAIASLPPQSVIVLQTSSQNPTGCDPSPTQWRELAATFIMHGHFAFLDAAYLGFVTGDVYADAESIRIFASASVPLLVAATYGKAFGLYGERVGILLIPAPKPEVAERIERQMKLLARAETGAMPAFGSRIVETVLKDVELRRIWEDDVKVIADQLRKRRVRLRRTLEDLETPRNWKYITDQVGIFSYMGLSSEQIDLLREKHHVYMQDTSRLSIAGLNLANIEHVARSIDAVIRQTEK